MMAQFHKLNELRAAGEITEAAYENQRHEIYVALGLEDPFPPSDSGSGPAETTA